MNATRRLLAFAHAAEDPACRFRIGQFIPFLQQAGWQVSLRTRHPPFPWMTPWRNPALRAIHERVAFSSRRLVRRWDIRAANRFDVVFLNRDLLEGRFAYESALFARNPRVVFDYDDAIFLGEKAAHIKQICERAAWVIAGNEYLADFARQFSARVAVIPTVVDVDRYRTLPERAEGRLRVGWMGSDQSIRETLFPHLEMFGELQREFDFEFVIVSRPKPVLPVRSLRWRFVEWSPTVETGIGAEFDVGVMPLVDSPFQRGKCGCKILQYMSASRPVVASPVGVNRDLVAHGERGFVAATRAEWRDAIATLLADATLRRRMGHSGRAFVETHYSIGRWFPEWLSIIEAVRREPA